MNKKMNNKGFSLVELIVVIAIMAVLVGVLAPQFIKYVEKSRQSTDITNLDSIKQVVEAYYADRDGLPSKIKIEVDTTNKVFICKEGSNDVSSTVLSQGGVQSTKVKGTWKTQLSATWDTVNNKWTYTGASKYYQTVNNQIIPE